MSENSPENVTDDITVKIVLYPEDGDKLAIRELTYGVQPFILFEAAYDEGTEQVALVMTGSLINNFDDLLETVEGYAEALREAVENHRAREAAEDGGADG